MHTMTNTGVQGRAAKQHILCYEDDLVLLLDAQKDEAYIDILTYDHVPLHKIVKLTGTCMTNTVTVHRVAKRVSEHVSRH